MAPPFDVAEVTLDTARGERRALVATPTRHLRIKPGDMKRDDRVDFRPDPVAKRAQEARGDAKLMIFRGKDDVGQGSWAIDGTVDEGQAAAVGEELVAGAPLGVAGAARPLITFELRRGGEPVNPVEFVG